jgi:hypothetical protein
MEFYGRRHMERPRLRWETYHQEGLFVNAKYKRMEETSSGKDHQKENYRRSQGRTWAVTSL